MIWRPLDAATSDANASCDASTSTRSFRRSLRDKGTASSTRALDRSESQSPNNIPITSKSSVDKLCESIATSADDDMQTSFKDMGFSIAMHTRNQQAGTTRR